MRKENTSLRKENTLLRKENAILRKENIILRNRIDELEEKVKHKKTSENSSIPPSQDENRPKKNQSLRKKSGIKAGGQKGHKGSFLKMTNSPDIIEDHIPQYCPLCSEPLTSEAILMNSRQIIDIPPIEIQRIEHRIYSRQCSCGHCSQGEFPEYVSNHVCYGPNIQSLIAYWSVRQYLPVNRIVEMFDQLLNVNMSQGTVINILNTYAKKCRSTYEMIKRQIVRSQSIGSDETGCKVNGKKHWLWIWQTQNLSYLTVSPSRGFQTIASEFPAGLPRSTLVHDCWSSHFKIKAKTHQLCIAHLLRELNYFIELKQSTWPGKFKNILLESLKLKSCFGEKDYREKVTQLKHHAHEFIEKTINSSSKKLLAFKKRMIKYEKYLFVFLEQWDVPPDNNASERGIRNVKVKLKVSNQFKSYQGAQNFAIIRSVIDTCIKNNNRIFYALTLVPNLATE